MSKEVEIYLEKKFDGKERGKQADLWTDGSNEFWLPHSQIIAEEPIFVKGIESQEFKVTIPEWLAIRKGIV